MNNWMNVSNLEPNRNYEFWVVGANSKGDEEASDSKVIKTKGERKILLYKISLPFTC
jgi:hypothetical protein